MSQTTYPAAPDLALAGQVDGVGPHSIQSRSNESSSGVGFGLGVIKGTLDSQFLLPSVTGFSLLGITCFKHDTDNQGLSGSLGINPKEFAGILTQGDVWVVVEEAVAEGDAVYLRHTANGALVPGQFRNDADTARCDLITNARWKKGSTGAGVALLQVNAP